MQVRTDYINGRLDAKLLDSVLSEFNGVLSSQLTWLNKTFGKAQRNAQRTKNRLYYKPVIYSNEKDYISLEPNTTIGNFSFFDIQDTSEITTDYNPNITTNVGLIFFGDLLSIYTTNTEFYSIENVKADILDVLRKKRLTRCSFDVLSVSERLENVYRGYSIEEVETQFMMYPYFALRFELELRYIQNDCNTVVTLPVLTDDLGLMLTDDLLEYSVDDIGV